MNCEEYNCLAEWFGRQKVFPIGPRIYAVHCGT